MKALSPRSLLTLSAILIAGTASAAVINPTDPLNLGADVNTLPAAIGTELGNTGSTEWDDLTTFEYTMTMENGDGYTTGDTLSTVTITGASPGGSDLVTTFVPNGFSRALAAQDPSSGTQSLVYGSGNTAAITFDQAVAGVAFTIGSSGSTVREVRLYTDVARTQEITAAFASFPSSSGVDFYGYLDGVQIRAVEIVGTSSQFNFDDFSVAFGAIPEPGTLTLGVLGIVLLTAARRRRQG